MVQVNIYEAKTKLSALIGQIESGGEPILICRNGRPVAQLGPVVAAADPLTADPNLKVTFHKSPALPLDPEDWPKAFS